MTPHSTRLSEKRLAALERLRAQKGSLRRGVRAADNQNEINAEYFEPFVRRRHVADPASGDRVSITELKGFLEEFKKQKRAKKAAEASKPPTSNAVSAGLWQDLLEQAKGRNFGETFFRWLGGVSIDAGLSATPVEELERLQEEVGFRKRALEAMLSLTNHELEELEAQIHAKRSLANGVR